MVRISDESYLMGGTVDGRLTSKVDVHTAIPAGGDPEIDAV